MTQAVTGEITKLHSREWYRQGCPQIDLGEKKTGVTIALKAENHLITEV